MSTIEKPRIRVRAGTAADIKKVLNKAADNISDLMDVVDSVPFSDQFNVADHGNTPRSPTSAPESASGSGAAAMVARYSDPQEGNGITEAYRLFAEQLCNLGARVEKSEASLKAVALLLASVLGKGKEAAEMFGAGDDEKDDEDDKKDDDTAEKGKVRVDNIGNVANLMKTLMGTSRSSVPSLVTPPSMAVIKSGNQWDAEIELADAMGDHTAVMRLRTLRMRANVVASTGATLAENARHGGDFGIKSPGSSRTGF